MKKVVLSILLLSCLPLMACADDSVLTLQNQMAAIATWKIQMQSSLSALQADMAALKSQRAEAGYSRAEVDAMIQKLKEDQSWVKVIAPATPAPVVTPAVPTSSTPYVYNNPYNYNYPVQTGAMTWKYGTYQINGLIQSIYFQGQGQSWQIVATNSSQSLVYVIPQITFKMYVNPQMNVYTSNGAALSWNNSQMGTTFREDGTPCDVASMPSGITMAPMGLSNLSLSISPNVANTKESSPANAMNAYMRSPTSSLIITPSCGGSNGLGAVLLSPGQTMAWNLNAMINTYQLSTKNGDTNYSSGPWTIGAAFLTTEYQQ